MSLTLPLLISVVVLLVAFLPETSSTETEATSPKGDYVVLLHGSGRTALSMKPLEWFLRQRGYRVINQTYPSLRYSVEQLSDVYLKNLLDQKITDPAAKVHFVTHSLGGIIVRQYLSSHQLPNLGRVVMLAPPNHGSEIIDHLRSLWVCRKLLGASRLELGTDADSVPVKLGSVHFDCGVIAGDRSFNPWLSSYLPEPNDGKVSVESAKVGGMRDFLVLHSTHTWLMCRTQTLRQTLEFLERGQFLRSTVPQFPS